MAKFILERSIEILSEYETSRGKTPEVYIRGVIGSGYDPDWKFAPPIAIDVKFGIGREYTNNDEISAILSRGKELGMELFIATKKEAEKMLSIDPTLGMQSLVAERLANTWHSPSDGDETPFTR